MRITALSGGVGGARFLRGLLDALETFDPVSDGNSPHGDVRDPDALGSVGSVGSVDAAAHEITVIGNTGDDISLFGLRVCPDLDTVMYTLGGGIHEGQGWGRADETSVVQSELMAYGALPDWFSLGDRDFATHIARTQLLGQGHSLSEATAQLSTRWGLPAHGVRLLPMTDVPVETHVVLEQGGEDRAVHFQQWWVQMRAAIPAKRFVVAGLDRATAAPGVLDAIRSADVVLLPPSNPVVSIGIILGVPGVRDALRGTQAPVVGVTPIIDGTPVRGHADACLAALDLPTTSAAVAGLYADFLDGWIVAPSDPMLADPRPAALRKVALRDHHVLLTGRDKAAETARTALELAVELRANTGSARPKTSVETSTETSTESSGQ